MTALRAVRPREGVRGRVVALAVGLGLDDRAAHTVHEQRPADQRPGGRHGVARQVERRDHCRCGRQPRPARRRSIVPHPAMCDATPAVPVPASSLQPVAAGAQRQLGVGVELAVPLRVLDVAGMVDDVGRGRLGGRHVRRSRAARGRHGGPGPRAQADAGRRPRSPSAIRPAGPPAGRNTSASPSSSAGSQARAAAAAAAVTTARSAGTSAAPPKWSKSRWVRTTGRVRSIAQRPRRARRPGCRRRPGHRAPGGRRPASTSTVPAAPRSSSTLRARHDGVAELALRRHQAVAHRQRPDRDQRQRPSQCSRRDIERRLGSGGCGGSAWASAAPAPCRPGSCARCATRSSARRSRRPRRACGGRRRGRRSIGSIAKMRSARANFAIAQEHHGPPGHHRLRRAPRAASSQT